MSRHAKKQDRLRRNRQRQELRTTFDSIQRKGKYFKRVLRKRGICLPFYDMYDSYAEEFIKVAAEARSQFSSLLDIIELEDTEYFESDRSSFAPGMRQILWDPENEVKGYGVNSQDANINGCTNAFRAPDGSVRTLVVIRKVVPKTSPHREFKYAFKLVALLHELGHVHDMVREINFDHAAPSFKVIEAEVFAHLYALRRMADRNYYQCFNLLVDALKDSVSADTYLGEVAVRTLEQMPKGELVDVNSISLDPLTPADLEALGPDGRRAFGVLR